ncbi:MAG TPA: ATP-binding protein [Sedimentisphaerales bacterium]|nr:ATP-binding protein [Sedimentisphaerales bacterium]
MPLTLGQIKTGFNGFQSILDLDNQIAPEHYEINISNWIDANMCAPLGAILYRRKTENIPVRITSISTMVTSVLRKNHFLSQFGVAEKPDSYGTTIEYRRFETVGKVHEDFQQYVIRYFRSGSLGLPAMTPALLKRFRESLFEVFSNAIEHSYTEHGIFTCGQFFPKQQRLLFTITDLGIGIDGNIYKNLQRKLPAGLAIIWAMSGKTTRRGRSGGLGLQLIQEFIKLNKGRLIIVSSAGYWELSKGKVSTATLSGAFPGTVVTIDIDTADKSSYCLTSEIDSSDVF